MLNVKLHTFAPLVLVIGDFIDCAGRKLLKAYRPAFPVYVRPVQYNCRRPECLGKGRRLA